MKTRIMLIVVILIGITINLSAQTPFSDGLSKGKSANKMILVNIYSDNDNWCKRMDDVYNSDAIRNYVNSNFIYVKLNSNGSEKISFNGKDYTAATLSKYFGGTGYPTHVILNPDGSTIKFKYNGESSGSFSGFLDVGDFEKFLKFFVEGKNKDTDLGKAF